MSWIAKHAYRQQEKCVAIGRYLSNEILHQTIAR